MHVLRLCIALSATLTLATTASESGKYSDETRTIEYKKTWHPSYERTLYQHLIKSHGKLVTVQCTAYVSGVTSYSGSEKPNKQEESKPLDYPEIAFNSCKGIWDMYKNSPTARHSKNDCSLS